MRLTQLSSITGVNRGALQKDLEIYLQKRNLINIEPSGRLITRKGIDYLKVIDDLDKPAPRKKRVVKKKVVKKSTRKKASKK